MFSEVKRDLASLSSRQEALCVDVDPGSEGKLLDFYVRITPRVLDAERCSIFIRDRQNGKVWLKNGTGLTERGIEVRLDDSIVGKVITSGKPHIVNDVQDRNGAHRWVDTQTGFTTREVICVPVRSAVGMTIGAIEVLNKNARGGFNEQDQAVLEEIGEHLQAVVDSVFLSQEAVGMSHRLARVAARAIGVGLIAVGASVFVLVALSVYGGLPFLFA